MVDEACSHLPATFCDIHLPSPSSIDASIIVHHHHTSGVCQADKTARVYQIQRTREPRVIHYQRYAPTCRQGQTSFKATVQISSSSGIQTQQGLVRHLQRALVGPAEEAPVPVRQSTRTACRGESLPSAFNLYVHMYAKLWPEGAEASMEGTKVTRLGRAPDPTDWTP